MRIETVVGGAAPPSIRRIAIRERIDVDRVGRNVVLEDDLARVLVDSPPALTLTVRLIVAIMPGNRLRDVHDAVCRAVTNCERRGSGRRIL